MNNAFHWPTFILAFIGALGGLASVKMVVDYCRPCRIVGKMISRYNNINRDETQTFFLFKLSVLAKHKPFSLRQIKCEIEDLKGEKFTAPALNNRLVVFAAPEDNSIRQKLSVSGEDFLNNSSFLPVNTNIDGYLFFRFEGNLDREIRSTTFIFESFENKMKKLEFRESDIHREQLFWDDTIWQTVDQK
jgi:hypothetical protein